MGLQETTAERIRALLLEIRRGNAAAKEQLLALYRPQLKRLAQADLGRREPGGHNPSDIAQVTLQAIADHLDEFRGNTPQEFDAWAHRIEERTIMQVERDARRQKRDMRATVSMEDAGTPDLPSLIPSASQQIFQREQWMRVMEALAKLPVAQSQAVRLRHLEECSLVEIAKKLGRSEQAVASLIRHGIAALRQTLDLTLDGEVVMQIENMRRSPKGAPVSDD